MIAADTSTWIAYFQGEHGEDTELLDKALEDRQVLMAPVVLTELLSDPKIALDVAETLTRLPLIEIKPGNGPGPCERKRWGNGERRALAMH
jgi:hypothetical protein